MGEITFSCTFETCFVKEMIFNEAQPKLILGATRFMVPGISFLKNTVLNEMQPGRDPGERGPQGIYIYIYCSLREEATCSTRAAAKR